MGGGGVEAAFTVDARVHVEPAAERTRGVTGPFMQVPHEVQHAFRRHAANEAGMVKSLIYPTLPLDTPGAPP